MDRFQQTIPIYNVKQIDRSTNYLTKIENLNFKMIAINTLEKIKK